MKILLTNDDGYNAPGILALNEMLRPGHNVTLIAPDREKSAVSHGITLNGPMRIDTVKLAGGNEGYAISGTPVDCVKLGLAQCFTTPPDLIISGINPGCNIGIDINYSGTVAAAREAALNGIPGISVSIKKGGMMDLKGMSRFIRHLLDTRFGDGFPKGTFLNINAPGILLDDVTGVKITRQASNNLSKQFEKRMDPRKRSYYWYGELDKVDGEPDTDVFALSQNYISITPLQCDTTDYETMERLAPFHLP